MNLTARLFILALCYAAAPLLPGQDTPGSAGFSCGLNATYIFLNRTGHHVPYQQLVTDFMAQKNPDSLLAIKTVLSEHGCKTTGVKTDADFFLDNKSPAIVFLQLSGFSPKNENHFSYLVRASRQQGVEFLDPVFDLTSASIISWDSFTRLYQGAALIPNE